MDTAHTALGFSPSPGELIAGKYEIERMLGQGGMGAVFSARNRLTGRRVALKWVLPDKANPGSRARLLREAQATCSVHHPNVVDVYDVSEHEGGLFIVMEYLDGDSLAALLEVRGQLEPGELIGLLMPAMRGVHAAHEAGVIHRDLKPDNILLCEVPSGEVLPKVLDFGISKTLGSGDPLHTSLTHTGALIGTPHFMALEQVDGSGDIDVRTDVYAFGVILYLGLTGQLPFDGENLGELILKIGTRDPAPPRTLCPELSPELELVVLEAMARRREDRYSSVEALARALEPFAEGVPFRPHSSEETARRISLRSSGSKVARAGAAPSSSIGLRRRKLAASALASVLMAAAGGYLWLSTSDEPRAHDPVPMAAHAPTASVPPAAEGASTPAARDPAPQLPNAAPPEPLEADPAAEMAAGPAVDEGEGTAAAGSEPAAPVGGLAESPTHEASPGARVVSETQAKRRRREGARAARRRARRVHRDLDAAPPNTDNRIRGQRTPGLSADDF